MKSENLTEQPYPNIRFLTQRNRRFLVQETQSISLHPQSERN